MAGELEPWSYEPSEQELAEGAEFWSLPEETRRAALEYARGLSLERPEPEPLPDEGDVKFILVGVQQGGRAILFASSDVAEAKFARQYGGIDRVEIRPGGPVARIPRLVAFVGAKIGVFEQYIGDDYRDAVRTMLGEWERKAAAARRQLEAGEPS